MNNLTIFTIRHGQSDYNVQKRYAGTTDVPLNETGVRDTIEAAKTLQSLGIHIDLIILSTLQRSAQTASLLFKNIPMVQTPLCNERNYGEMQGKTVEEVKAIVPPIRYIRSGNDTHSLNPPQGESFGILRQRAQRFHKFVFQNCNSGNILIVSHGVFLQQFHGILQGKNWKDSLAAEVPNLTLNCFYFSGKDLVKTETQALCGQQCSW